MMSLTENGEQLDKWWQGNDNDQMPLRLTPIQSFYSGKNVFITGGTGFLGKLVVEKLLWSCPDIGNLYLLVRDKKGKDLVSRINALTDSLVFGRLKRDFPGFKSKIKPLSGDCALPGLGLSEMDRETLVKEVNVIFHIAATVRFQEPLPFALTVNLKATMEIMKLAKGMQGLKSYVHVSTAFANCYTTQLGEHFYETPLDPVKLLNFVEGADPQLVKDITPKLIGKWPNTYTFTKSLAEDYIRTEAVGMPMGVFRPSIVVSSVDEPVPRWVDNWYGVSGFITACGSGLLRSVRAKKDGIANVVPVDMCVNGLIAAGWDVAERFKEVESMAKPTSRDIRIYNFVIDKENITWGQLYDLTSNYGLITPPSRALWYRYLIIQPNAMVHRVLRVLLHYIPAVMADAALMFTGKKAQFMGLYRRIDLMEEVVVFFTMQNWNFQNYNMPKLIDRMAPEDKMLYSCDMRKMKWMQYLETYFLGVRRHLLKDDDSTIPEARKKYFKLKIIHRIVQTIIILLTLRGTYKVIQFFSNFIKG